MAMGASTNWKANGEEPANGRLINDSANAIRSRDPGSYSYSFTPSLKENKLRATSIAVQRHGKYSSTSDMLQKYP